MEPSKDNPMKVLVDFGHLCKKRLGVQFVSLVAFGSIITDKFIPGWSDVDVFLIVKEDKPWIKRAR